jgi:TonB family protein
MPKYSKWGDGRVTRPILISIQLVPLATRISCMRGRFLSLTFQFTAMACLIVSSSPAKAQSTPGGNNQLSEVVLTKLSPPIYLPLAIAARITGDVRIQVQVRRDGSVASADVVSGHPMLNPAALASAQNSTFECRGCTGELTTYSLTYTFGFNDDSDCSNKRSRSAKCLYLWSCGNWHTVYHDLPSPSVTESQGHITILSGSRCVQTLYSNSLP